MSLTPCVLFEVAGTTYAVRALDVHHLDMLDLVTPVPNAPAFVDGLVYSRGLVVPVVSLRARFGFERIPYDVRTRLVVVRAGSRLVGLAVDSAHQFTALDLESASTPPEIVVAAGNDALERVLSLAGRLVLLLDVGRVIDPGPVFDATDDIAKETSNAEQ